MKIISRRAAKQAGLLRYYTGKPCPYGHNGDRYTSNGTCVQCSYQADPNSTHKITHAGQTLTVPQWAASLGLDKSALYRRLRVMSVEEALTPDKMSTVDKRRAILRSHGLTTIPQRELNPDIVAALVRDGMDVTQIAQHFGRTTSTIYGQRRKAKLPRKAWNRGVKQSEEHRAKNSEAHKGQEAWNKGLTGHLTEVELQRLSEAHKGQRSGFKGKRHTDEAKEIMRQQRLDRTPAKQCITMSTRKRSMNGVGPKVRRQQAILEVLGIEVERREAAPESVLAYKLLGFSQHDAAIHFHVPVLKIRRLLDKALLAHPELNNAAIDLRHQAARYLLASTANAKTRAMISASVKALPPDSDLTRQRKREGQRQRRASDDAVNPPTHNRLVKRRKHQRWRARKRGEIVLPDPATPARRRDGQQRRQEREARNGTAGKLSPEAVRAIRADQRPQSITAREYAISVALVSMIQHLTRYAKVC